MLKFTPVIHDVHEIPVGTYIAYLENGEQVVLTVNKIVNGYIAVINGCQWAFECSPVMAYAPFPKLRY